MLLKTAADVLSGNVIAVTARSVSFPERESNESVRFCSQIGVPQIIVEPAEDSVDASPAPSASPAPVKKGG